MHEHRRDGNRGRRLPLLVFGVLVASTGWILAVGNPVTKRPRSAPRAQLNDGYGRLPLSFEENRGQTDPRVKFLSRGSGYSLFLTATEAVLKLRDPSAHAGPQKPTGDGARFSALRIRLKGANPAPEVTGVDRLEGTSNYFIGRDPKAWHTKIPTFAGVRLRNVYPEVNLRYRGEQGRLEYDLEVGPGADASRIKLEFEGARKLEIDAEHNLVIRTGGGTVIEHAPRIYQTIAGARRAVSGGYVIKDARTVAFELGPYDESQPLTIDPLLTYASYLGGTGGDQGVSIAVDQTDGSAWVTGTTTSTDFPITPDAFQKTNFGNSDIFMTKVSPDGSALLYSTYAGGTSFEQATGIAIDPSGNAYATGLTLSSDFPVTIGAFQMILKGKQDAFVIALDRNGGLIYSTHLGTDAAGARIAVDSNGEAFVVGTTRSANFPTTPGTFQSQYPGSIGAPLVGFVTKFNPDGTGLVFSTFMGVTDGGWPNAVALDSADNVFISGGTSTGVNFNTQTCAPDLCGFVVELDNSGSSLEFSDNFPFATLFGIATDGAGDAHVVGTRGGPLLINLDPSGNPIFVMLNLGGNPTRIAIGPSGNIFLSGITTSTSLAITPDAYQPTYAGGGDAFVSVLDPSGTFNLYTSYLGGSGLDMAQGVAVDSVENAYLTGTTQSTDFPVTAGVFEDENPSTNGLAFVARIVPVLQSPTPTATATVTPVMTPVATTNNPPTPTVVRTPLPTRSSNATPFATATLTAIMTPVQTPFSVQTPTATATTTSGVTPTMTPTATPVAIGAVKIAPPGLNFRKVRVGRSSVAQAVRVFNPRANQAPAVVNGIALQSQISVLPPTGFTIDSLRSTCVDESPLAPGKQCRIVLKFAPLAVGPVIDSLVITGNFANSGEPVALVGVGR